MPESQSLQGKGDTGTGLANSTSAGQSEIVKALHSKPPAKTRPPTTDRGWKAVGWFGLLLAVIGLSDVALYWYPLAFESVEWQFGTVASSFGALPLATIGLAAVVGALLVNRNRGAMIVTAAGLLILALLMGMAYGLFATNLPMAMAATDGPQGPAIIRGVARTTIKGLGFGSAYVIAGVILLRNLPPRNH